ncbi:hypothetical protein BH09PSE1_BH09PSE1_05390 [soil metagenome]
MQRLQLPLFGYLLSATVVSAALWGLMFGLLALIFKIV